MEKAAAQPSVEPAIVGRTQQRVSDTVAGYGQYQGLAGLLLDLQRSHGNRYVQRMLAGAMVQRKCNCGGSCASCQQKEVELDRQATTQAESSSMPFIMREALGSTGEVRCQTGLRISEPGDAHEQEADRVADEVMRMPDSSGTQASETLRVEYGAAGNNEPQLERKEAASGGRTTGSSSALNTSHHSSGGVPLEPQTRAMMEERMGHDFSHVRVHSSSEAARSAKSVNAVAYTVGSDIVFGAGQYAPQTRAGQRLIAHELTHVTQQGSGGSTLQPSLIQRQTPTGPTPTGPTPAPTGPSSAPTGSTSGPSTSPPTAPGGGLSTPMLEQIARRLREAMAGLGTDEEAIYSALSGRTREQVDAITETYQRMYPGRNLQADLRDELNDDELLRLALFDPTNTRTGTAAEQVARQLDQAMRGLGTDESSIFAALTGRTATEIANIKTAYRSLTNRDLEADLRDELSGAELIEALRLLNQGVLAPEDEIYLAIAGLGTDEARIFRVVDAMRGNPTAIRELDRNYRTKYGDLIADLRGDLSGDDYDHVRAVLAPVLQDVSFQDCSNPSNIQDVRTAIREALEDIQAAIRVLSKGLSGMSATERDTFNKFFDPSSSGVDQRFVGDVLSNYRRIQAEMNRDYSIQCETATDPTCASAPPGSHVGGYVPPLVFRFFGFHTDVHVCPGFFGDPQPTQVRTIIHETTHNAIVAEDRPYAQDPNYARMTPRGSLAGQIPLIGPIITVALRRDTLNAPDAYACFALTIAGLFEPSCDCAPTCPP